MGSEASDNKFGIMTTLGFNDISLLNFRAHFVEKVFRVSSRYRNISDQ